MRAATLLATIVLLSARIPTNANQPAGSVAGIITDTTGHGLPGAHIVLTATDGRVHETTANALGRYHIAPLPLGRSRISASMAGFETKVSGISVTDQGATWSGSLLLAGSPIGEGSIERRVLRETDGDALDCGRHSTPAEARHLENSLACGTEAAKQRQSFAVILQHMAGGRRGGHGLLAGPDGVIQRFEYERGGLTFRMRPCPSPLVARGENIPGFGFACQPQG